jgi:hypothetical protein
MTLLNITETAGRLRTSAKNVRELIKNDKYFPCYAYGKKSFRVIAENLDKWVIKQTQNRQGINA